MISRVSNPHSRSFSFSPVVQNGRVLVEKLAGVHFLGNRLLIKPSEAKASPERIPDTGGSYRGGSL